MEQMLKACLCQDRKECVHSLILLVIFFFFQNREKTNLHQVERMKFSHTCPVAALSQGHGNVPELPKPNSQGEMCPLS